MSFIMRPVRFAGGFVIEGSGMFDGSSGYLTRTPSAGNSKTFTISCVFKRGNLASGIIFAAGDWNAAYGAAYFNAGNQLIFEDYVGSGEFNIRLTSTPLFRDPSAYYHLVVKFNSTAGTPSASDNGMFINGVQITDLEHNTYPDQDDTSAWNTAVAHRVGWAVNGGSLYYDGYVAQLVHIEGQALDASSFGETTDDGFWQINDVSELTFGTNGFLLSGQSVASGFDSSSGSNPVYTGSSASVGFSGANAANVIDRTRSTTSTTGNLGNLASTGDDGRVVWEVDLGSSKAIKQINVAGISGTNIDDLAGFDLAHSTDSSSWTVMGSRSNISTTARDYTVTGDVTGRYIAVLARAINWGSSAWTAAVLEASSEINNSFIKAGTIDATNDSPTNGDA